MTYALVLDAAVLACLDLPVDDAAELVPVLARWLAVVPWGRA